MNQTRTGEIIRGIAALLLFGVLLLGFPIGLYTVAGSPIPAEPPSWDQVTTAVMLPDTDHRLFLGAVRLLGWSAWLLFTIITGIETVGYLAGRTTPSFPRPARPMQLLARDMIAAAALLFSTGATLTSPAAAAVQTVSTDARPTVPGQGIAGQSPTADDLEDREPLLGDAAQPRRPIPAPADRRIHIVEQGDTLWDISQRAYGSGSAYPEIFEASRPIDQPDGVPSLTGPDRLHPGQHLRLPQLRQRDSALEKEPRKASSERSDAQHPRRDKSGQAPAETGTGKDPAAAEHSHSPSQVPSPVVAPPPPPATSAPPSPAQSAALPANQDDTSFAITLRSGSYIGIGLAAALSIALAATRLHRRRRHQPGHLDSPAPTPPPVAEARKAHLDTCTERQVPIPTDAKLIERDRVAPAPDHITMGVRAGSLVTVPLPGLSIGLTGPGAPATARALATELLAKASRDRVELLIPQPDTEVIFPHGDVAERARSLPGLTITPSVNAAIAHLEAEILRRARLLETTEEPDLDALRAADPAEPLPTLLLTASVPEHDASTLQAIVQLGHRYGIGAFILGPWPAGTSLHITGDATVTDAQGPLADTLAGAHLFHLTAEDALGMLHTLHTATGADATSEQADSKTPPSDAPELGQDIKVAPIPAPRAAAEEQQPPVRLQLLGPVRLLTADGPINTGLRRSARELLAYLALHPDGITRDQCIDALSPDHDPNAEAAAAMLFQSAMGNIRKVLRTATGLRTPMFVIRAADRYHLDPNLIDVDLWHLANTLTQARQATNDANRVAALQPVITLYTGEFASDLTHPWAENHREHLHRTALDAIARLAQLLQDDHPDQALAALEHAIAQDPYAEPLYRTIMQLQARLGHPDAVKRTYRLLTEHLTTLDVEPDDQTHRLFAELQRPSTR
ncbi:hypothetical protein GCM10010182_00290 [Actinomadura cremea]|nr:hypothetical protein GCM10010182_00290 [Actinomadura cremea]